MSTEQSTVEDWANQDELAQYIRECYEESGTPPTVTEVGEQSPHCRNYYSRPGVAWDDRLRNAGAPGADDVVAEALCTMLDERYPWEDKLVVSSRDFDHLDLGQTRIGHKLAQLADGRRTPDAAAGFEIERYGVRKRAKLWRVDSPGGGH